MTVQGENLKFNEAKAVSGTSEVRLERRFVPRVPGIIFLNI